MNKARRKAIDGLINDLSKIKDAIEKTSLISDLETLHGDIETIKDEEQEYFDNMPESMQGGDKGSIAQEAIDKLGEAYEPVEALFSALNDFDFDAVITALNEAQA